VAINLIPLKATVFFEPDEYVQHCEYKGHKQPVVERDWANYQSSYLVEEDDD